MGGLSQQELLRCLEAALALQRCRSLDELAPAAMAMVRQVVPYESGAFFPVNTAARTFARPYSVDIEDRLFDDYESYYQSRDTYREKVFSLAPVPRTDRCSDYMDFAGWARNEHRHDFLLANDMQYLAGVQLFTGGELRGSISIHRGRRQRDFSDAEMLQMEILASYIQLVYDVLAREQRASELLVELDDAAQGICLFDRNLRCLYENEAARTLLAGGNNGLRAKIREICGDYLRMIGAGGERLFVYNGLFRAGSATVRFSLSHMPGVERGSRLLFSFEPVAGRQNGFDWSRAFSAREKEILELLVQGKSNREIGERLFISAETVKSHIKRLFYKTGSHSRAALVGIAMQAKAERDGDG